MFITLISLAPICSITSSTTTSETDMKWTHSPGPGQYCIAMKLSQYIHWSRCTECTELARAGAGSSQKAWAGLARLGSDRRQSQNPSLAWLGLKWVMIFRGELGSRSKKMEIFELSSDRAPGKGKFWAWPIKTNMDQIGQNFQILTNIIFFFTFLS